MVSIVVIPMSATNLNRLMPNDLNVDSDLGHFVWESNMISWFIGLHDAIDGDTRSTIS